MNTNAVVLDRPEHLALRSLELTAPGDADLVVEIDRSGISTGTERLLWSGRMPQLPGHGLSAGARLRIGRPRHRSRAEIGTARSASTSSFPARAASAMCVACSAAPPRAWSSLRRGCVPVDERLGEQASCWRSQRPRTTRRRRDVWRLDHAPSSSSATACSGRLLARLTVAAGIAPPTVWEPNPDAQRRRGRLRRDPSRRRYAARLRAIYDVSGDAVAARHADRTPRAGRRGRARRLLQRAAVVRVSAGLHARGAHPRRRRVAEPAICSPSRSSSNPARLSLDGLITHRAARPMRAAPPTAPPSTIPPA